jgi:outer membrane protein assembly factor BamB
VIDNYAAFVVAGPLAVTIEQRRDQEAVVAYDFDSGKERWKYQYPALFSETLGGDGPRATPTIHEDKVYSLGATGVLACLELATGRKLWEVNILKENDSHNLDWGMSGSPLVHGEVVLVNPGNQKGTAASRSLVAYDLRTGKHVWGAGHSKAGYASPVLESVAGRLQFILFDGAGLAGFDTSAHEELWRFPWWSQFDINAAQPVAVGDDRFLITSAAGAAVVRVTNQNKSFAAEQVWKNNKLKCYFGTPALFEGNLYGIDDTLLACVEAATGRQRWKARAGDYGHGQLLLSGKLLLVLSETGALALAEANPDRFREWGRIQAIEGKTWNYPTLAGNRILVRNHLEMAAYDLATE